MSSLSSSDRKFYIIVSISIIIMYGFGFLPTFGQITPDGMRVLGIFLGCIFAWCFGELVWSSLLGLVTLVIFGYGSMSEVFASAYGNNTIATFITALVFCYSIEKSGLLSEVSRWIIGQKWAQKSIWGLILAFFLASAILGAMATNSMPTIILMWALFYETAKEMGLPKQDPIAVIFLCGIGVISLIGVAIMPYSSMAVLVRGAAETIDPNFAFNTGEYLLLNFLTALIFIPLIVLILRLIVGKKVNFEVPKREPYRMNLNTESKISLVFLIIIILSMIVPNFMSTDNPIRILFNDRLTIVGTFMLASSILMIIHLKGNTVLDIPTAINNFPWPLLLLVSSALAISDYITADGMGIVPTIVSSLDPLVEGKSALVITLIFTAMGLIMTNFINDVVTCVVLYPIAAQFIINAGGSEMLFAILFGQATIQGCLMPSGSFVGAMFHGNVEWMKSKDIFFYVSIMEIVLLVVLLFVALFGGLLGM